LQEVPISQQFRAVDLHPRLDQALLRPREAATQALERIDREHRRMLLVVRMEVRPVMRFTGFKEHPNNDAEESRELGHEANLTSSGVGLPG
jgi:hypothetical protein